MATEQPTGSETVESRMAAFLGGPEPEVAPEPEAAAVEETPEETPPAEEAAPDVEDLDVDGEIYKVPPSLKAKVSEWKEGSLRREDYTRKTQELADITRQAQLAAEAIQTRQAFEQEIAAERKELSKAEAELERYKTVDWGDLDDKTYRTLRDNRETLKDRVKELNETIGQKAQSLNGKLAEHKQRLLDEGHKFLQKAIPGWNKEVAQVANEGARSAGYTDGELSNVYDARFAVLSWKAAQFDKLQSGKADAVRQVQTAPPVIKPGAKGTPQAAAKDKGLREQLKAKGDLKSAAALLVSRMR